MKNRDIYILMAAHLSCDINQGALPAILPFLMVHYGMSYAEVAGLVFACNFASSIIQPLFGYMADKVVKPWLMPLGIFLAGGGIAALGLFTTYWGMFVAVMLTGVGAALFHPEAARLANRVSGAQKGTGISIFSVGGNAGFAVGPMLATFALLTVGMKGTLVFAAPAVIMPLLLWTRIRRLHAAKPTYAPQPSAQTDAAAAAPRADEWGAFSRLTVIIFARSVIFSGLNTFLPLYWVHVLLQSEMAGGTALTILFVVGAFATLVGGRLADRLGYVKLLRMTLAFMTPLLVFFTWTHEVWLATALLTAISFGLFGSYSAMVVLGQQYLASRIGFASGVTLGLAVSIGGVVTPALGWLADGYGLVSSLQVLGAVSLLGAVFSFLLTPPKAA